MAVNRVNPTLFIGLGGQGQTALTAVKRRLLAAFGSVPPMVKFLEIDSAALDPGPKAILNPDEFFSISFNGAGAYVQDRKRQLSKWLDVDRIPRASIANCQDGCGQIPQIGRLLLHFYMDEILARVEAAMKDIHGVDVVQNLGWEYGGARPQVVFFSSIAGGTGSGTVLDLACAIRTKTGHDWDHNAFLVMPGVFSKSGTPGVLYVEENGYAFLKQLDFMLSHQQEIIDGRYGDLFHVETLDGSVYDMVDPFDSITLVGDTTQGTPPTVFKKPVHLAAAVGEIMYLLTCDMPADDKGNGKDAANVGQNLRGRLNNQFNQEHPWDGGKKCWYAGMGVAVLHFPADSFHEWARNVYLDGLVSALKAGEAAPGEANVEGLVNDFLNGPPALQEMGAEQNQIIDAIKLGLPFLPQVPKTVANAGQVEQVWQTNEAALAVSVSDMASAASDSLGGLLGASRAALEIRVDDIVRKQGSQVAMDFVTHLAGYFEAVAGEMKAEKAKCEAAAKSSESAIGAAKNRCIEALGKLFGKKAEIEKALADLRRSLGDCASAKGGAIKREKAELLCHSLGVSLGELRTALEGRASALNDLSERAASEMVETQMRMDRQGLAESVISVRPDRGELALTAVDPADFYTWFREKTGSAATGFWGMPVSQAWPLLVEYAEIREVTKSIGVSDLVATLRAWPNDRRTQHAQRASQMAAPLLAVRPGKVGGRVKEDATSACFYYAAHPDFVASFEDPPLDSMLKDKTTQMVDPSVIADRDNAYFFRHWGCVPAYALDEFPEMRRQYLRHSRDPQRWSLHLDKRWQDRLDDLDPDSGTDTMDWVWTLSSSDIEYLRRIRKAGTTHWLTFETEKPGGTVVTDEVNLGQGLAVAREAFFSNRDYVEQCRTRIEAAIIAKGNEVVVADLAGCMERLKATRESMPVDDPRRPLVDKDIDALDEYIQSLR